MQCPLTESTVCNFILITFNACSRIKLWSTLSDDEGWLSGFEEEMETKCSTYHLKLKREYKNPALDTRGESSLFQSVSGYGPITLNAAAASAPLSYPCLYFPSRLKLSSVNSIWQNALADHVFLMRYHSGSMNFTLNNWCDSILAWTSVRSSRAVWWSNYTHDIS